MNLTRTDIRNLLADFYREGCLDPSVNMGELTVLLEDLSDLFIREDGYNCWARVRLDSKRFGRPPYDRYLARLKQQYYKLFASRIRETVFSMVDGRANFEAWEDYFLKALATSNQQLFQEMVTWELIPDERAENKLVFYRELVGLIQKDRWADCFRHYKLMSAQARDAYTRSCLLLIQSQIQFYCLQCFAEANVPINGAKQEFPSNPMIPRIEGEYFLKLGETEKAKSFISSSISQSPLNPENYLSMSMVSSAEKKFDAAIQWIQDAEAINFSDQNIYIKYLKVIKEAASAESWKEKISEWEERCRIFSEAAPGANQLYNFYRFAGQAFSSAKNFRRAEEYFLGAIEIAPELPSAYIDLADSFSDQNELNKAEQWLHKGAGIDPDNFDFYWSLAILYEKMGEERYQEALDNFAKGLELRPDWNGWTYNSMGVVCFRSRDFSTAAHYFLKAIAAFSGDTIYTDNLKDALENIADTIELDTFFEENKSYAAMLADASFDLSKNYLDNSNYLRAGTFIDKALALAPNDWRYIEQKGLIAEAAGNIQLAEELYRKNYENIGDFLAANRLGIFFYNRGEHQQAVDFYAKAIALQPSDNVLYENIALAYEQLGFLNLAIENYQLANRIAPTKVSIYHALGRLFEAVDPQQSYQYYHDAIIHDKSGLSDNIVGISLYNQERFEEALPHFNKAVSADSSQHNFRLWLIACLSRLNSTEEALEMLAVMIEKDPANPDLIMRRAYLFFRQQRYNLAYESFNAVADSYPDDYLLWEWYYAAALLSAKHDRLEEITKKLTSFEPLPEDLLVKAAVMYLDSGQQEGQERGMRCARLVLERNPMNTEAMRILGNFHRLRNEIEISRNYLQKAVELAPQNDLIVNDYGVLLYEQGQIAEAIANYKQAIAIKPNPIYHKNLELALRDQAAASI